MCKSKIDSGYQTKGSEPHTKGFEGEQAASLLKSLSAQQSEPLSTTTRYCSARIINRWGTEITNVTLRHRRSNDPNRENSQNWISIDEDGDSGTMSITFETGFLAPGDYWYVEFTAADRTWKCKDTFYCDLRSDDDGQTVDCILKAGDEDLHISMNSGSCDVSLF